MPAAERTWTVEEVQSLPADGKRYEVIDGELLVTPAPRSIHQDAVLELAFRLREYLKRERVGHVFVSPADIVFGSRTLVQPDVFVAPLVSGGKPRDWSDVKGLLLAIEVLSPSSARADRTLKRRLYQQQQVPEYWLLDLDARLIERWRQDDERPEHLDDVVEWLPEGARAPLTVNLRELFTSILRE